MTTARRLRSEDGPGGLGVGPRSVILQNFWRRRFLLPPRHKFVIAFAACDPRLPLLGSEFFGSRLIDLASFGIECNFVNVGCRPAGNQLLLQILHDHFRLALQRISVARAASAETEQ